MAGIELWEQARKDRLEVQKEAREQGQAALAECRKKGQSTSQGELSAVGCFNAPWRECTGQLEDCLTLGVVLCGDHHERLHVGKDDVNKLQPPEHYWGAGPQIRWALSEGHLIVWCKCGEPFYPTNRSTTHEDGVVVQHFRCPQEHEMEVAVSYQWKEEPVKSDLSLVGAAS